MSTSSPKILNPDITTNIVKDMEFQVEKAVLLDPNTIEISLVVNDFKDVLETHSEHGRGTGYSITLEKHHTSVQLEGQPPTKLLLLNQNAVQIRIRIGSADKKEEYFPLGIMFRLKNKLAAEKRKSDLLGRRNFSFARMHLYGRSLYITDNFIDCGPDGDYKFSVIIQREHDGAIGIIDPGIGHPPR